jgi:hypothetical protein
MTVTFVNGAGIGAPGTLEELQNMVGSLEAQLMTLYEEKEQGGPSGVDTDVVALYEQKLREGSRLSDEMRAAAESLEAQLHSMYEDRESVPQGSDITESLVTQLHALYHEKEHAGSQAEMVTSLEAQVVSLLDEKFELERHLVAKTAEAEKTLAKARAMLGALVDTSLSAS